MNKEQSDSSKSGNDFLNTLRFGFIPYWPLAALLTLVFLLLGFVYMRYQQPVYSISATVAINDKEKGAEEAQLIRSLNVYATGKVIENEVLIFQSWTLMSDVIRNLSLYAPLYEEGKVNAGPAYLSSPIIIEASDPDSLVEKKKIYFDYNATSNRVRIADKDYPLNQWISFPFGTLRFLPNPSKRRIADRQLYFDLLASRKLVEGMLANLTVTTGGKLSSIIFLQYKDEIAERGEAVLNGLLDSYTRASLQINSQLAANTLAFVEERLANVERDLDSIENRVQRYKSKQGVVDLSEQGRLYLQNVAESDRKASDATLQLAVLDQVDRHVRLPENRTGIVPTTLGIDDPVLTSLLQRLNELELEYTNVRTKTGENNPLVRSIANEINKIRPNILNIIGNQRQRIRASLNSLNSTSGRYNSMIRTIPQKERGLLEISRQQEIKNNIYSFLLQKREEAALSNSSAIADSRIVDRAKASIKPVSPKKPLILLGAIAMAFALTVAYILYKDVLTSRSLFRSELEKSSLIPVVDELLYTQQKAQNFNNPEFSNQFFRLQAGLSRYVKAENAKKFLVTSHLKGDGKAFVGTNLAASFAYLGRKAILVDLNLHNPQVTAANGLKGAKGFHEYILGEIDLPDVVQATQVQNISIIPAGAPTMESMKLLVDQKTNALFHYLEQNFDCIIVIAPSIASSADAFVASRFCDLTLLIVRHGKTAKTSIQKLSESAHQASINNPVVVFNSVKGRGTLKNYFGYGYGYGYETVFNKSQIG